MMCSRKNPQKWGHDLGVWDGAALIWSLLQSSGWLMGAVTVKAVWNSKCTGPGHPSVLPTGTWQMPWFSVTNSTVAMQYPYLQEDILGVGTPPSGQMYFIVWGQNLICCTVQQAPWGPTLVSWEIQLQPSAQVNSGSSRIVERKVSRGGGQRVRDGGAVRCGSLLPLKPVSDRSPRYLEAERWTESL